MNKPIPITVVVIAIVAVFVAPSLLFAPNQVNAAADTRSSAGDAAAAAAAGGGSAAAATAAGDAAAQLQLQEVAVRAARGFGRWR